MPTADLSVTMDDGKTTVAHREYVVRPTRLLSVGTSGRRLRSPR
jgi:hypothetical protein